MKDALTLYLGGGLLQLGGKWYHFSEIKTQLRSKGGGVLKPVWDLLYMRKVNVQDEAEFRSEAHKKVRYTDSAQTWWYTPKI